MTKIFREGPGIQFIKNREYWDGEELDVVEIGISTINAKINPWDIESTGLSGDVLMINENNVVEWKKPFDDDSKLREKYPALNDAWRTLMEALNEYEMAKKLVKDYE